MRDGSSPDEVPASPLPLMREAAALAYVDDLEHPVLGAEDTHHLLSVLRLRPGELVVVGDGAGAYRSCRLGSGGDSGDASSRRRRRVLELEAVGSRSQAARPEPEIAVGFSLAKGDRNDWAVAKLSELGVDRIVPLLCERTAVRWKSDSAPRQRERWRRIAREASMQARRLFLPEVCDPLPPAEAAAILAPDVALAEPGGSSALSLELPAVLIGPEGGFSAAELGMGLPTVSLGETILRIETAAVAAGAALTALRSGLVGPRSAGPGDS